MMGNLRTRDEDEARAARRPRARKNGPVEGLGALHLGRVLAALRTALGLTQTDLARLARVKRASISEYERALTTPDASTLERLLAAMRFRWSAIDLGAWFIEQLLGERSGYRSRALEEHRRIAARRAGGKA
jgi:transcriptional regulator with XRE-family HTH domain